MIGPPLFPQTLHNNRFGTIPGADDADLRMTYCAFVICALLDDWSCIDLANALSYIHRCRVRPVPPPSPPPPP
jgi:prenyltransferase beta subunit